MSQFGQWDAHIEPSSAVVTAVWEVTLTSDPSPLPAADDAIEWSTNSGFTVGTGTGAGVVTSYNSSTKRLRFYRSSILGASSETAQKAAFPVEAFTIKKFGGGAWSGTIVSIAKKNSRGFHINPPWFMGTPPSTRTQTALTVGDLLKVEHPYGTNLNRTVTNTNLGVDSFEITPAWSADQINDAPALVQYASGFTTNQDLALMSTGDRQIPELLSRNMQLIDGALYRHLVTLTSDVQSAAGSVLYQNITGLSFTVASGTNYRWFALLLYTAAATTEGVRVAVSAPAFTYNAYFTQVGLAATGSTSNAWTNAQTAVDSGVVSTGSVATSGGNILLASGVIRPSAAGTVQLRFAPEVGTNLGDITVRAGSTLEWW